MTIHISHATQSVVVPFRADVRQLFPHAVQFDWEGAAHLMIPHGLDETKLLRNLDYPVPSPIAEHYSFPSADGKRPFEKQVITSALMVMNQHAYILNSMGTGKTKSCIWAFDYLRSIGKAHRMMVVAPLSTLDFTWKKELFLTIPSLSVVVLTGTAERRKKLLAEQHDVYVINHAGLKVIEKELASRFDIDVFAFDEAAAYRNGRAERSKIARRLARDRAYVWGLTGSPTPTDPTDAYGLAHLITPERAPKSFVQFRHNTMLQVSQFKWMPRADAAETVSKLLQPSVRFSLDEIIELPPLIERDIEVQMGPRQQAVYDALEEYAAALLKEGSITAANGGVVFTKMLQAACGWVYGDGDRQIIPLDNQARIDTLIDIINSNDHKLLVFSPFKSAAAGIAEALKKEGIDFATVTGDTPQKDRTAIFNAFQGSTKYKVINAHPESMSHGLTLTAADCIVWFGPVTKLETFEQANARITRPGQAHKQQILRLVGCMTEKVLYRRLAAKQDLQMNILDMIAEITAAGENQ